MHYDLKLLKLVWGEIMRQKNVAVDTTSPACSWLEMEICVLDSKQIMNRKISFFTKMHSIKKNKASL